MSDLSKQLGEIKRRDADHKTWLFTNDGMVSGSTTAETDRAALLNIIEVQIPGMLKSRANTVEAFNTKEDWFGRRAEIANELRRQATLIESLTKDKANEKEKW